MTAGQTLAHYRILERLGAGGMGVVYKALDTHLNRTVAIKVLPPESVADPGRRQRFIQEAHAASALDHPNIVTVFDIAEADGQHFIVMQYVAGRTLRALLARGTPPLADTLRYAIQMADALARAHSKGIVHRDLKPENVMVTDEGQVKILDFGLAKLTEAVDPAEGETLTQDRAVGATEEGQVVGTAAYMSPEQAQGKKVDARSDIFSFGTVLYELITGRQPFRGDNRLSVLSAIVRDEPEKLAAPPDLERLIARAMRKDPERRLQSMADIRNALADLKEETEPGAAAPTSVPARRRRTWIPAAALAVLAVAGPAAWLRFGRTQPEAPLPPPRVVPFTSFPGNEYDPAFSPDGNQIAFAWDGEKGDNFDIYIKLIGAGAPLRLTTNPAIDRHPAWSPDGRYIAFHRATGLGQQGEIWIVPALGGPERKVATGYRQQYSDAGAASWSPDGNWLALADRPSPQEPVSLFLLSLEAGERRKLTAPPDASHADGAPALSPDGRSLAFARRSGSAGENLYVVALDPQSRPSGEPQRLSSHYYNIYGLAWSADGQSIVFSAGLGATSNLYRVSARGRSGPGKPQRLASFGGDAYALSISRQGRLAYQQSVTDVNVWRRPGPLGNGSPVQLIASTKLDSTAQYSPDGRRIAFLSDRSGTEEIWVCDSDGSGAVPVTSMNGPATGSPRWSPDGRWIAFDSTKYGHRDIFVVAAEGGFLRRLTTEPSEDVRPSWSIDGRWIYFGSNRSGDWQVWKAPSEGGVAVQVTRNGSREAFEAFESLDGKFVYYTKQAPAAGIWQVPAGGGEETRVIGRGSQGGWAITPEGIGFFSFPDSGPVIEFFRFSTGAIAPIAALPKGTRIQTAQPHLAISRDLRWILHNQIDRVESDIMLVENFR